MDQIKRAILFAIPMSICNLRCDYCYLSHREESFQGEQIKFQYPPEYVAQAFSVERLGGICYFNFCADGETLLTKGLNEYIYQIISRGHYGEIVTNLTVTAALEEILNFPKEMLQRITFKCSFHYLELKKRGLLQLFADNVKKIWSAGCSANIELTPSDILIPYLDELKQFSLEHFGALPHITIARDDRTSGIDYLTELPMEEYDQIWGSFDSEFWSFKKQLFGIKRKEYCYAGAWSLYVNLATGNTTQCYCSDYTQNVFDKINKPIQFIPIGRCKLPHCYNGHMLLSLGCIPEIGEVHYGDIRDRKKALGGEWLQPELKSFFNTQLKESNGLPSPFQQTLNKQHSRLLCLCNTGQRVIRRYLTK